VASLDSLATGIAPAHLKVMMNLTASHDTPRFGTSIYNPGRYKYHNSPREDSTYLIDRPDEPARQIQEMILAQQFTYIGAPHIWNGDEVGMWGADDPDDRKPMVWSDLRYEDEVLHPFGRQRRRDRVAPDTVLFRVYQELIALRKQNLRLFVDGKLNWLLTDDKRGLLVYDRVLGDRRAVIAFNVSESPQRFSVEGKGRYRVAYPADGNVGAAGDSLKAELPPRAAGAWIRE
jgi:glycosidase